MRVVLCIALTLTMPWHDRERITVQMLLKNANEQHVCTCDLMDMIDRLIYSVIVQLLVKACEQSKSPGINIDLGNASFDRLYISSQCKR